MSDDIFYFEIFKGGQITDFNTAELQGWVISRFARVERSVNLKIQLHFKPQNEIDFQSILLNSSIISFGSKIKLLQGLGLQKSTCEKLRKISNIRNGFAHNVIISEYAGPTLKEGVNEIPEEEFKFNSIISVLNSNGKLVKKKALELALEFNELSSEVNNELIKYIDPELLDSSN